MDSKDFLKQEKENLRKIFKAKRASLTDEEVRLRSQKICQRFINQLLPIVLKSEFEEEKIFGIYLSSKKEVVTNQIISHFEKHKIKFSYPKIISKEKSLDFVLSAENQGFAASKIFPTVLEPTDGKIVFPNILIVPLVAFDSSFSRIGMGGGFFDRTLEFLKKQNAKIISIGLAYDFQASNSFLPNEETDSKLDFVVTEKNIFTPTQTPLNLTGKIF